MFSRFGMVETSQQQRHVLYLPVKQSPQFLHNVVSCIPGEVVMCHQSEQQRASTTALRGACVKGDDNGGVPEPSVC